MAASTQEAPGPGLAGWLRLASRADGEQREGGGRQREASLGGLAGLARVCGGAVLILETTPCGERTKPTVEKKNHDFSRAGTFPTRAPHQIPPPLCAHPRAAPWTTNDSRASGRLRADVARARRRRHAIPRVVARKALAHPAVEGHVVGVGKHLVQRRGRA
eukprot:2502736-Prymnesium_polylepis.1